MTLSTASGLVLLCLLQAAFGYITYFSPRRPLAGERSPPGSPWPLPKSWQRSENLLTIDPMRFYIFSSAVDCDVIDKAMKRYIKTVIPISTAKKKANLPVLRRLKINLDDKYECGYPEHGMDESYTLEVPNSGTAELQAQTVWGALRGLETFSQLVYQDENGLLLINSTEIDDAPRYAYRGVLIDTARHFQPIGALKKNLDAMAYNKFNAFHWHIIDDQSFPFESKVFPNLTQLGAYSPKHVYTQRNIRDIIQYARNRGIRVIPAFNLPGRTQTFRHLGVLTPCYGEGDDKPSTSNYPEHTSQENLNPMIDKTYTVVKTLVEEIQSVFFDEYIHLGMGEVYYGCWRSSPEIKKFMEENDYTHFSQVEEHYVKKTLQDVEDLGYKYIIWQDPIDNDFEIEPGSIIEVWKDTSVDSDLDSWQSYMGPIAKKGYPIILSSCWNMNEVSYGQDWKTYYECDPRKFEGTEEEKNLVIGGEVCMFDENVDGTNLLSTLWPTASAVAERLWSPEEVTTDSDSAAFRLDEHRCRMVKRGIPAQAILNGFCGDYDWGLDEDVEDM